MCACQPARTVKHQTYSPHKGQDSPAPTPWTTLAQSIPFIILGIQETVLMASLPYLPCPGKMECWDPLGNVTLDDSAFMKLRVAKHTPACCEGDLVLFEACSLILGV